MTAPTLAQRLARDGLLARAAGRQVQHANTVDGNVRAQRVCAPGDYPVSHVCSVLLAAKRQLRRIIPDDFEWSFFFDGGVRMVARFRWNKARVGVPYREIEDMDYAVVLYALTDLDWEKERARRAPLAGVDVVEVATPFEIERAAIAARRTEIGPHGPAARRGVNRA